MLKEILKEAGYKESSASSECLEREVWHTTPGGKSTQTKIKHIRDKKFRDIELEKCKKHYEDKDEKKNGKDDPIEKHKELLKELEQRRRGLSDAVKGFGGPKEKGSDRGEASKDLSGDIMKKLKDIKKSVGITSKNKTQIIKRVIEGYYHG